MATSRAVFLGTVSGVRDTAIMLSHDLPSAPARIYTFAVAQRWKGDARAHLDITVALDMCEFRFTIGRRYVVFAGGKVGKLGTSACSANTLESEAKSLLRELGPPLPPA